MIFLKSIATFIYDAILLLSNTINKYNLTGLIPVHSSVSCKTETPWSFGSQLIKYLKMSNFNGLSGHIEFDEAGLRTNLTISIVDRTKNSVDLVIISKQCVLFALYLNSK